MLVVRAARWYWNLNARLFIALKNVMPADPWVLVGLVLVAWVFGLIATGHNDAALVFGLGSLFLPAARFVLER
jgi:hypothetical protein